MKQFEDCESNIWDEWPSGLLVCRNPKYPAPVKLSYLISEFGPLKELELV